MNSHLINSLLETSPLQEQWTILCVDDEENILQSLKRTLRKEGYKLLLATSGTEALSLIEKEPVHLVISDQRMPIMPGSDLLKEIKKRCPNTVRIMLSGYAEPHAILDAVNHGEIYKFITKPWQDEELRESIRNCLSHYNQVTEKKEAFEKITDDNRRLEEISSRLTRSIVEQSQVIRFFEKILEQSPVPLLWVNEAGMVTLTNPALAQCLAPHKIAWEGKMLEECLPPLTATVIRHSLQQKTMNVTVELVLGDRPYQLQLCVLHHGGIGNGCLIQVLEPGLKHYATDRKGDFS